MPPTTQPPSTPLNSSTPNVPATSTPPATCPVDATAPAPTAAAKIAASHSTVNTAGSNDPPPTTPPAQDRNINPSHNQEPEDDDNDTDLVSDPLITVDIIFHNIYSGDRCWTAIRRASHYPIDRILANFGRIVKSGVFEQVICVCATKYTFTVTVACTRTVEEGGMEWFVKLG